MRIVDLFAGTGWDVAARDLGLGTPLGIEWDDAACATRAAVGMPTLQADVAGLDPLDFGPIDGLIASPPCQAYSAAGKGLGKLDRPAVWSCARDLAAGCDSRHATQLHDKRSLLTVEPLRWALALRPRWIAFEQVPPVLELWILFAQLLGEHGYSATAGILHAEQFGVPQTRKRAFMVARLDGEAQLPRPTHERYRKGAQRGASDLLPWVSMAEALGWSGAGHMRSNYGTGGDPAKRGERDLAEPAPTRNRWKLAMGTMPNSTQRDESEPAPTLFFAHDAAAKRWIPTHLNPRQVSARPRPIAEPAPTLTANGLHLGVAAWDEGTGQSRDGRAESPSPVRVSIEQASRLQSYPPDFPWQGSRSQQFMQIGNAVPPQLAVAVLAAATNGAAAPAGTGTAVTPVSAVGTPITRHRRRAVLHGPGTAQLGTSRR